MTTKHVEAQMKVRHYISVEGQGYFNGWVIVNDVPRFTHNLDSCHTFSNISTAEKVVEFLECSGYNTDVHHYSAV